MKGRDDIESYLLRMDLPYEEIGQDTWMINSGQADRNLVVRLASPVAVFRCKIMDVPEQGQAELFRLLLELNIADLLHGAYGIEGNTIVLSDALELENLDFNEFQATVEDMSLAVANHFTKLSKFKQPA
jgi:hypothetical protein